MIRGLLLDEVEQGLLAADLDDDGAAVLVAVALHVAAQAELLGLKDEKDVAQRRIEIKFFHQLTQMGPRMSCLGLASLQETR